MPLKAASAPPDGRGGEGADLKISPRWRPSRRTSPAVTSRAVVRGERARSRNKDGFLLSREGGGDGSEGRDGNPAGFYSDFGRRVKTNEKLNSDSITS